jgi:hypothetical protein
LDAGAAYGVVPVILTVTLAGDEGDPSPPESGGSTVNVTLYSVVDVGCVSSGAGGDQLNSPETFPFPLIAAVIAVDVLVDTDPAAQTIDEKLPASSASFKFPIASPTLDVKATGMEITGVTGACSPSSFL